MGSIPHLIDSQAAICSEVPLSLTGVLLLLLVFILDTEARSRLREGGESAFYRVTKLETGAASHADIARFDSVTRYCKKHKNATVAELVDAPD